MRAGSARSALRQVMAAGVTGTYRTLAAAAGLAPDQARATLKEMRRCGEGAAGERCRTAGRVGAAPAIYGPYVAPLDSLAHVRQVWR